MTVNQNKPPLIIIAGPTAVGKSDVAVKLAKRIGGEIVSADSMQVYKGMDIGTAKMTAEEMNGIPHYLINELDPTEVFNVVRFQQMAKEYCSRIIACGKIPILTGGTGFYIQSLLYDIDFQEEEDDNELRLSLENRARQIGKEALHAELENVDPESAKAIPAGNVKRVVRALEYYYKSGEKISRHNEEQRDRDSVWNEAFFVLTDEREKIYERINTRVDRMKEMGLTEEVCRLRSKGLRKDMVSMLGIGYRQILAAFDGECSLDEAYEEIKKDTRHFARRQLTWFKREKGVIWIDRSVYQDDDAMINLMMDIIKTRKIIKDETEES